MHELGIAQSALEAALREMENHGARKITAITLRIGDLAAVDPEAMRFAFGAVTAGSAADGAKLAIETVPAIAFCHKCNEEFTTESRSFCKCPRCGDFSGDLRSGKEIELARLELD